MRLLHSKAVPGPISLVTLCQEMDLVAVAARNTIILHNALSFQRLFQLTTSAEVTALLWSPAGKLLVVGLDSGEVHLYRVEDGRRVVLFSATATEATSSAFAPHCHTTAVTHMCWVRQQLPSAWSDSEHGLLHAIETFLPPLSMEDDDLSAFTHLVRPSTEEVSVLACLSTSGLVDFKVYGWFPFLCLQLPALLTPQLPALLAGSFSCHSFALLQDLSALEVLFTAPSSTPDLLRATVDLEALHKHPLAVATVASHCAYLREMLGTVEGAGRWLRSTWADTTALLTKKFQFLVDDLESARQTITPAKALLHLHVTGTMSKTLHTFLDCNFTAKHCQKVEAALHIQIQKLVRRVVEVLQPSLAHVIFTVEELLSAVFCDHAVYSSFGLHPGTLQRLLEQAKTYLQQTHTLLADLRESKAAILELLHWLNKQQARAERVLATPARSRMPWASEELRSVDVCRITRQLQMGVLFPRIPFLESDPHSDAVSMQVLHQRLERLYCDAFGSLNARPVAAAVGIDRIAPASLLCNPRTVSTHYNVAGGTGSAHDFVHVAMAFVAPHMHCNVLVVLRRPQSGAGLESGMLRFDLGDELHACCLCHTGEEMQLLCLVTRTKSPIYSETFVAPLDLDQLTFLPFDAGRLHQVLQTDSSAAEEAQLGSPTILPRVVPSQQSPQLCSSGKRRTACMATTPPGMIILWDMEDGEEGGEEDEQEEMLPER